MLLCPQRSPLLRYYILYIYIYMCKWLSHGLLHYSRGPEVSYVTMRCINGHHYGHIELASFFSAKDVFALFFCTGSMDSGLNNGLYTQVGSRLYTQVASQIGHHLKVFLSNFGHFKNIQSRFKHHIADSRAETLYMPISIYNADSHMQSIQI